MGIYSRDYMDDGPRGMPLRGARTHWAIPALLVANVLVYFIQKATLSRVTGDPGATGWLSLSLPDVIPGLELWRLVTYGFCHGGLGHLVFNMFVLWMFGRLVEPIHGSREFLAFFLAGVVLSGAAHLLFQAVTGTPAGVIGASGGVMAVVFLTAMHFPRSQVLLFFVFPMELRWLAVLYAVVDVMGLVGGGGGVAHAAHLAGAAFGVGYKHFGWRLLRPGRLRRLRLDQLRLRRPRLRKKPDRTAGSRSDLEREVDAILAKIHEKGTDSLTEEERQTLIEASRRMHQR